MLERAHFLVVYVGSAALVAYLAACLSSPQVAPFTCQASSADSAERCELVATLAAFAPEAGVMDLEVFAAAIGASSPPAQVASDRQ